MRESLISVIVPIYKVEKYLDCCINSIINQTYANLEIILVDDGSPDNCPAICDEYAKKDGRIKVIHKENGGVSSARNAGLKVASGDYIGFVDSDDWIEPEMYESLATMIQHDKTDISSVGIVKSKDEAKNICENSNQSICFSQREYMLKFFKVGSQETVYYMCNKLFKKSLIADDLFPLEYSVGEDTIALFKVLKKAKYISVSNQKLYHYRTQSGITSNFSKNLFSLTNVWDEIVHESESTDYLEYANINRKRINFTLLSELAVSNEYKNYPDKVKLYRTALKEAKKDLLSANISKSRKIFILWFCIDYKSAAFLLSKIKINRQ